MTAKNQKMAIYIGAALVAGWVANKKYQERALAQRLDTATDQMIAQNQHLF